jgi:methionyl aminopeptidase
VFREPIARANGCAVVRTYTGHGINDLFHTAPNIPHYAKNKAVGTMKAGMVRETIAVFDVDLILRT